MDELVDYSKLYKLCKKSKPKPSDKERNQIREIIAYLWCENLERDNEFDTLLPKLGLRFGVKIDYEYDGRDDESIEYTQRDVKQLIWVFNRHRREQKKNLVA